MWSCWARAAAFAFIALWAGCVPLETADLAGDGMAPVPGRTFRMGTDSAEIADLMALTGVDRPEIFEPEMPSRSVTVAAFLLDTVDVTNRDFVAFTGVRTEWSKQNADSTGHNGRYLEHWVNGTPPSALLDHPVTFVTWYAAGAFCDWRGKRLPTEVEWEWASRGGPLGAEFPWGDEPPIGNAVVSWGGNGIDGTVPVGSYAPNAFGLYDLSGNVWKFLGDPWSDDDTTPPDSSRAYDRRRRVVRGGSYEANVANVRSRYRDSHRPWDARETVGFRCADDGVA